MCFGLDVRYVTHAVTGTTLLSDYLSCLHGDCTLFWDLFPVLQLPFKCICLIFHYIHQISIKFILTLHVDQNVRKEPASTVYITVVCHFIIDNVTCCSFVLLLQFDREQEINVCDSLLSTKSVLIFLITTKERMLLFVFIPVRHKPAMRPFAQCSQLLCFRTRCEATEKAY